MAWILNSSIYADGSAVSWFLFIRLNFLFLFCFPIFLALSIYFRFQLRAKPYGSDAKFDFQVRFNLNNIGFGEIQNARTKLLAYFYHLKMEEIKLYSQIKQAHATRLQMSPEHSSSSNLILVTNQNILPFKFSTRKVIFRLNFYCCYWVATS